MQQLHWSTLQTRHAKSSKRSWYYTHREKKEEISYGRMTKPPKKFKMHRDNTKTPPKTSIADRELRTVSWGNDSHPTCVFKPVNGIPTLPLTTTVVWSRTRTGMYYFTVSWNLNMFSLPRKWYWKYIVSGITASRKKAKEKYRGVFEIQRSGDKTSSGEIGLDIRTRASPKVGQDQVSGGVSVLCWHAAPVAYVLWKPCTVR